MLQKLSEQVQGGSVVGGGGLQWVASIGVAVAVGIAYFLAGWLGLALLTDPEHVAVFWPAAGVATGALVALGKRGRSPVVAAVMVATVAANLTGDRSVWSALAFALCNASEALLAAWLIERWCGPAFSLDSLRQVLGLLVATAVAAAIAAVGAAVAMTLFGPSTAPVLSVWQVWFVSDSLGIITVAPLLIGLFRSVDDPPNLPELREGLLAVLVLTAASVIGFASPTSHWVSVLPLALLFPLLLWPAARCRPVFAAAAVFVLSSSVVWTITFGIGRLGDPNVPLDNRVHAAQAALLAIAVCALALAALFAERRQHEAVLAERDAQLALAGKTALVGSYVFDINTGRVQISEGYAAIYGLPEGTDEYGRDEWEGRVHPDDVGRLNVLRSEAFAARRCEHTSEYRILRPDGEIRWIESRAFLSYDGAGRPTRMVGVNIDVTDRKQSEEHQDLLIAELDHRVKNVLASVAAVVKQTSEHNGPTSDFVSALDRRIQSMAKAHALLSRSHWRGVSLAELVSHELAPYAAADNTKVEGPYVGLTADETQAISMVLHELVTNAAKYGAFSTPRGRVSVHWNWVLNGEEPRRLRLEWHEDGGPAVTTPAQLGYGTSVIHELIPYELGGTVELEFAAGGVGCTMEIAVASDDNVQDRSVIQPLPGGD
jgi:PAS domain S-box-containing protein